MWATTNHDLSQPGLAGENLGVVSLTYPGELRGLIINNWCFRGPARLARPHSHEDVLIQGANGTISGQSDDLVISTLAPEPAHTSPVIEGQWFPDAFGHAMRHFLAAVEAGREPLSSGRQNLVAVATFEAAYRSAASGRPVSVPDLLADAS